MFFGVLTEALSEISTYHAENLIQNASRIDLSTADCTSTAAQYTVDNSIVFQDSTDMLLETYSCGSVSIFHSNSIVNGTNLPIYSKVNTNTSGFLSYLKNGLGYNTIFSLATSAVADQITISLSGSYSCFYLISFSPTDSQTTFAVSIPYVDEENKFNTVELDIVTSSTSTTRSKYNDSSQLPNVIDWSFSQLYGWTTNEFNGDYTSPTGLTVYAVYSTQGNITNTVIRPITASANIRYQYVIQYPLSSITLHMWTGEFHTSSGVAIYPLSSE